MAVVLGMVASSRLGRPWRRGTVLMIVCLSIMRCRRRGFRDDALEDRVIVRCHGMPAGIDINGGF